MSNKLAQTIQEDLSGLFGDANFSTTVAYRRWTAAAAPVVNEDTGLVTTLPYAETLNVPAYVGEFTDEEVISFKLVVEHGDLKCMFRRSSVTGPYSTQDLVVWKTETYRVYKLQQATLGSATTQPDLVLCFIRKIGRSPNP